MIDQNIAAEQVRRLSGLDHYPRGEDQKAGLRELRKTAEAAHSAKVLERVIDDILATTNRCPAPAHLRAALWEEGEKHKEKQATCPKCGGTGWTIIYELITYAGKSLHVHKKERLPDIHNDEEAFAFQRQIDAAGVENQIVLSAARRCGCL
jgi:hypothetical protein